MVAVSLLSWLSSLRHSTTVVSELVLVEHCRSYIPNAVFSKLLDNSVESEQVALIVNTFSAKSLRYLEWNGGNQMEWRSFRGILHDVCYPKILFKKINLNRDINNRRHIIAIKLCQIASLNLSFRDIFTRILWRHHLCHRSSDREVSRGYWSGLVTMKTVASIRMKQLQMSKQRRGLKSVNPQWYKNWNLPNSVKFIRRTWLCTG